MNKQAANALGLCHKAGKLTSGDCLVKSVIKSQKAQLLLLAVDTSDRTKKEYYHLARKNKVPIIEISTKEELGWLVGKPPRAALAITDHRFAQGISEIFERGEA